MSKKKILVVDDVELMRKTMGDIVNSDPGLEVVGYAEDGMQAVKVAADKHPDLILLDLEMPEWDGMGFLRHYRHQYEGKVIVLSAKVGGRLKPIGDAALRSGADAVLEKPMGEADASGRPSAESCKIIIDKIYEVLGS